MKWRINYFNQKVESGILNLPAKLLARYLRYADRLEKFGPDLGMPHTRSLGNGLFELRLKASEGIARFYISRKLVIPLLWCMCL